MTSPRGFLPPVPQVAGRFVFKYVLVFIILASGILTMGYLYFRDFEHKYRLEVERQISAVAELKVAQLVQYRKERMGDAAMFFHNDSFSSLVHRFFDNPHETEIGSGLHAWMDKLRTTYHYDLVFLLDTWQSPVSRHPECSTLLIPLFRIDVPRFSGKAR